MVGAGHVHAPGYLRWLAASPEVELVGVYDVSPGRAAELAGAAGVPVLRSLEDALGRAEAAVVCPEPTRQLALVQAAADKGLPVLVEKPLGVTALQSSSLLALADKVPISVSFPVRYHPAALRLRRAAREGELGEVLAVWATNRNRFPGGWFADLSLAGGGCLLDHVVHLADLVHWIWGVQWAWVRAEAGVLHHPGLPAEDTAVVLVECTNGMVMTVDPSMSRPDGMPGALDLTLRVWGENAVAAIDIFAERVDSFDMGGRLRQELVGPDIDAAMLEDWVGSVRGGLPPPVPASDGFVATSLAFAAQRAVARHVGVAVAAGPPGQEPS